MNNRQKQGREETALYADGKSMSALKSYLCSMPKRPGGKVDAETCRRCESSCAFGRRYVCLYDAGEQPVPKKYNKKKAKEDTQMPVNKKSCDQVTLQEQLEAKLSENLTLVDAQKKLLADLKEMEEKLIKAQMAYTEEYTARKRIQLQLYKLKARLYDMEHPEEE